MSAAKKKKSTNLSTPSNSAIVVGDGWAALSAVGFLVQQIHRQNCESDMPTHRRVIWVTGSGSRMLSALPGMETGPGVELWQRLAQGFGLDVGEATQGSFLREFRNKAFREPSWLKAPTPESRKEILRESLWGPERQIAPLWETRFALTLNEIELKIRDLLIGDSEEGAHWRALIHRIEEVPVTSFKIENGQVRGVVLASGEEIGSEEIIYADRWNALPTIQGLPKNLSFIRRREPASVLQATLTHPSPVGMGVLEGFFASLHKDVGEEIERHVWGHFSSDGSHSYWTLCLHGDEGEDNHQISKKFRRLKNALDKMFTGDSWLPEGKSEFMMNVSAELVRFQEATIFSEGEAPTEIIELPQTQGLRFVTDGYGSSSALIQVALVLGLPTAEIYAAAHVTPEAVLTLGAYAEAEGMNLERPSAS